MRVAFHTLGCKVNHYETEAMREAFVSRGAEYVGEDSPADVYIINTCTVTNIADRKSRQYIRRVKRLNPEALIVVTGCYAQVEPEEVAALPEVDIVVGNGQKSRICQIVLEHLEHRECAGGAKEIHILDREALSEYDYMGIVASGEPGMTRAYIKIQEGCDRFCSYCLIPFARGKVRSRDSEEIVKEALALLNSGVRELVLTGINTALYGTEEGFTFVFRDENGAPLPGLERIAAMTEEERRETAPIEILLARLDSIEGYDFRIRLSSLEPTVVDKKAVEKIIRYRRLCRHLHLSVQHGSSRILRGMNRNYDREEYLEIVNAIRSYDPYFGITTDIIVGFPGEDEEDFEDTLDIVRRSGFGRVHVFRYSPRKGTAGEKLPDAVAGAVKQRRAERLEQEADKTARDFIRLNFGRLHTVLAEEEQDGFITGYTDNYIKVYIDVTDSDQEIPRLGDFCIVELTEIYRDGCRAVIR